MSEELDLNLGEARRRHRSGHGNSGNGEGREESEARREGYAGWSGKSRSSEPWPGGGHAPKTAAGPFDLWRLLEILLRRWSWLLLGGLGLGSLAFLIGMQITGATAQVRLIRRENPNAFTAGSAEGSLPHAYLSRELSVLTLFSLMQSPEVFRRVSEKAHPPITPERLAEAVKVVEERNPDFVTLALSAKAPNPTLAAWANLYADEVVNYTKELQASEAGSISEFLKLKLKAVEAELSEANNRMIQFADQAGVIDVDQEVEAYLAQVTAVDTKYDTARIDFETLDYRIKNLQRALAEQGPANDRLQAATDQLNLLYAQGYKDAHPLVLRQKAVLADLQKKGDSPSTALPGLSVPGGSLANAIRLQILELQSMQEVRKRQLEEYESLKARIQDKAKTLSRTAVNYAHLKARQKRLEDLRTTLASKQQEAQLLQENALGYFKLFTRATPESVTSRHRLFAVTLTSMVGALLGLLAAAMLALLAEVMDNRVRTAADVERVTGLPLLASLGDLCKMSAEEQINWAFRTLTILQGKLNASSDETLVCGLISSRHGEGRSTWIDLLVSAAMQRGMRVLTVTTRPSTVAEEMSEELPREPALLPMAPRTTLTKNVLSFPAQVTEQFSDPQAQPVVHIPLPGWVWNLERRRQWHSALEHWQQIESLVLLVELPPACQPESVLLAEHLPQVIWLASSGMATAEETRAQLETLRHARCNLVGAVLNREPTSFLRKHVASWMRRISLFCLCALGWQTTIAAPATAAGPNPQAAAQAGAAPPAATHLSFSITTPVHRAPWQQRLTLGPGDTLDISLFGYPDLTRTNLVIGPDGRLSYLQVQEFPATGLTVDELRAKLDAELDRYYRAARTMVVPTRFNSKKYFILGKVVNEGVFVLDRPLTIIEAVARARGLRTAAFGRNTAEVADLARSFLVRDGQRVPVDFERLFHGGDLSQNIPLEPNDYLYFAPASSQEIFVLGEVLTPGVLGWGSEASLIPAISARGGFTERAYRKRVLVIRGSLQHPEAYAVDTGAILAGRTPDFRLEPRDIVYVNARPWIKVEELLDIAAQAFIEASVTIWTGRSIDPVITSPIIPTL